MKFATVILFILVYIIVLPPSAITQTSFPGAMNLREGKLTAQNHRNTAPPSVRGNETSERRPDCLGLMGKIAIVGYQRSLPICH